MADRSFLLFFSLMSPILTSVLLGLTAAGANVFGGGAAPDTVDLSQKIYSRLALHAGSGHFGL